MASSVGPIISLAILVGLGAVFLMAAILAFRGRRYWATVTMLVGTVLVFGGSISFLVGAFYQSQMIMASYSSTGSAPTSIWPEALLWGGLAAPFGLLLFGAGMIGICSRFGSLEKRAAELEVFNRQLQERIQG